MRLPIRKLCPRKYGGNKMIQVGRVSYQLSMMICALKKACHIKADLPNVHSLKQFQKILNAISLPEK